MPTMHSSARDTEDAWRLAVAAVISQNNALGGPKRGITSEASMVVGEAGLCGAGPWGMGGVWAGGVGKTNISCGVQHGQRHGAPVPTQGA